jgi:hypothetical protein
MRLKSSVSCRSELGPSWGLHFAPCSCAVFHVLHQGNGYLCVKGDSRLLPLHAGDVALLPGGEEHSILETPDASLCCNLAIGSGDIAVQIGYQSESAFSKAFKRAMGVAPGAYRKRQIAEPQRSHD